MPVFIDGHHLITPTSTAKTGTGSTATINTNGSVTFSSCATLSLNGVFSADYDNYMIVMRDTPVNSSSWVLQMRLRASGTDNSTANSYTYQYLWADGTSVAGGRASDSLTRIHGMTNGKREGLVLDVYGPYIAQPTAMRSYTVSGYNDAWLINYASTHNQSVSYDGCTFIAYDGTWSGLVCVYGAVK